MKIEELEIKICIENITLSISKVDLIITDNQTKLTGMIYNNKSECNVLERCIHYNSLITSKIILKKQIYSFEGECTNSYVRDNTGYFTFIGTLKTTYA